MNEYQFKDIYVGLEEKFEVAVSDEMLTKFCDITGDINPLHKDKEFAISMGHTQAVAYGMLTASFLSTLAGVYLPGKYSLIHEVETKFTAPVYPGDKLEVKGVVSEKNDAFEVFEMKVQITNQNGKKVLRGKMKVGLLHEKQ